MQHEHYLIENSKSLTDSRSYLETLDGLKPPCVRSESYAVVNNVKARQEPRFYVYAPSGLL